MATSETDRLDWKVYEEITKYIYETLGMEFGVKIEGYGSNFKVVGQSGVKHQIDVLTSNTDGVREYRTAIECKYWKKKINKDIVMKVSKIIEDARIDKGIIVSKSGYTKDALNFANHSNIELVELRQFDEKGHKVSSKEIAFALLNLQQHIIITRPEILNITADYVNKLKDETEMLNRHRYIIKLSNGAKIPLDSYATAFQRALTDANRLLQIATQRHEITGGILFDKTDNSFEKISAITFTGILKRIDKSYSKQFSLVDQVWLIMKSIFDERSFSILESGIIIEHKK